MRHISASTWQPKRRLAPRGNGVAVRLKQINLSYATDEDRILMRINTDDRSEFRFWLTRRIITQIRAGLEQVQHQVAVSIHTDISDKSQLKAVQQFEQATLAEQSDFSSGFAIDATSYPLGEAPLLIVSATMKASGDHTIGTFHFAADQQIAIDFDPKLAAGFVGLLNDILKSCDWNLTAVAALPPAPTFFDFPDKKTLH